MNPLRRLPRMLRSHCNCNRFQENTMDKSKKLTTNAGAPVPDNQNVMTSFKLWVKRNMQAYW